MDPLEPFRKIQTQLETVVSPMGLRMVGYAVLPGTPDHIQAVFEIDAEDVGKDQSEQEADKIADEFRAEIAAYERAEREKAAIARLEELAKKGKSLLD